MTAHLSKAAEHIILTVAFGPNQFAYRKGRGTRDALAHLTLAWVLSLNRRKKVAVYCSYVAGAFRHGFEWRETLGRISERSSLHLIDLAGSCLPQQSAQVVVEGQRSDKMILRNMLFQGTIVGPSPVEPFL